MRQAADELRAELAGDTVTFVVNRNINVSNVCIVGCAFCGFGQGRRSPDAYTHEREEFVAADPRRASRSGRPSCASSPASIPTGSWRTTRAGCGWRRRPRRDIHLHAYSPMEVAHMCDRSGLPPRDVFARLRDAGLGSVPGTAAEVLARRRARADQPEQAAGRALGGDHRGGARVRSALDRDRDVRPHRGAARAGRAHARRARAAGAHRRLHGVRAALVHPVPHAAGPHARDRGDLARGEPQAHRGVPARARAHRAEPAGELGEDGARRRDRGAALGRQRPRRHADGGEHLAPGRLLPRRQARPRRISSPPPTAPAARRPSARRCTAMRRRYPLVAAAA